MWLCPLLPSQSLVRRRAELWDIDFCYVLVWGEGLFSFCEGFSGLSMGCTLSFLGFFFLGRQSFTLFLSLSCIVLSCLVLGMLDQGASLIVCLLFYFFI